MKKIIKMIAIFITLSAIFIILMPQSVQATNTATNTAADLRPNQFMGSDLEEDIVNDINDSAEKIEKGVKIIGSFVSVGGLMVIGIKYMTGSLDEKAQYKKSMQPYLIGCILIFGASYIGPELIDIFKDKESGEDIGNTILGLIQTAGTIIAVGIVMLLGVKYMMGTTDERASYKKTMIPYLIGAILLFSAVTFASIIASEVEKWGEGNNGATGSGGSATYQDAVY